MTIKILQEGQDPRTKPYRMECSWCNCVFEFQEEDARYHGGDQRDDPSYSINCPTCKRPRTVNARETGWWP